MLALLTILRIAFIVWMRGYVGEVAGWEDAAAALLYGTRLSLRSAGFLAVGCAVANLAALLLAQRLADKVYRAYGLLCIFTLTVLYCARIPFYRQFHSGFNQLIFNAVHDDAYALLVSLTSQFQLPLRLMGASLLTWLLYRAFALWTDRLRFGFPDIRSVALRHIASPAFLLVLYLGARLVYFGGAMSEAGDVDWENAGVTRDRLLNEAILDDLQALRRAYEMNCRLESSTGLKIDPRTIRKRAARLTGKNPDEKDLDAFLEKKALGAPGKKPGHIFLIVSERHANWPLLERYRPLGIAEGLR